MELEEGEEDFGPKIFQKKICWMFPTRRCHRARNLQPPSPLLFPSSFSKREKRAPLSSFLCFVVERENHEVYVFFLWVPPFIPLFFFCDPICMSFAVYCVQESLDRQILDLTVSFITWFKLHVPLLFPPTVYLLFESSDLRSDGHCYFPGIFMCMSFACAHCVPFLFKLLILDQVAVMSLPEIRSGPSDSSDGPDLSSLSPIFLLNFHYCF